MAKHDDYIQDGAGYGKTYTNSPVNYQGDPEQKMEETQKA